MGEPTERSKTAVVVIDVQNDVVAQAYQRDEVIANIGSVVAKARQAGTQVIWVQHNDDELLPGTEGWQIVPELVPGDDEPVVHKQFRDSFMNTELETELARGEVGRLVVTGSQTDFCVRWTLHGAQARGYDTVLVADAHTTDAESPAGMPNGAEIIAHTNAIWGSQTSPSDSPAVVDAAELNF